MAATSKSDAAPTPQPDDAAPLARLTDGKHIAIFNWARAGLPDDTEWFDVHCDADGRIMLTPAKAVPAAAHDWAEERDRIAAAQKPRPYSHLTVDELREVEELTHEEWLDELRARGVLSGGRKKPGQLSIKPVARVPGALEHFLKERRGEA